MYINVNNNKINIFINKNFISKLKGLMFKKTFNYGICLVKCNSIHTFFMKQPIDVYMTDKNYQILYIYKNLKKNKIILPKKNVYYTFELPINITNYKLNEKIKLQ